MICAHGQVIKKIKLVGHMARMGKKRGACKVFVGKPVEKTLERRRCRFEDDIKQELTETRWESVE
jgi:hypothetical protein